jgi:hypothetical protein
MNFVQRFAHMKRLRSMMVKTTSRITPNRILNLVSQAPMANSIQLTRRIFRVEDSPTMNAVSPVLPGSEAIEILLGKDQPQYDAVPCVYLDTETRPMITRWRFTDEERALIAAGADLIHIQLTFQEPFHPTNMQVVKQDEMPEWLGD